MVVELDLLHLGKNRNNCLITREAVEKSLPSIYNKYIIYRVDNGYPIDFEEHNRSESDTSMQICGHIVSGAKTAFVERDGRTYLRVEGIISKLYQPQVKNIIERRDGHVSVSIEMRLLDWHKDENDTIIVDKFSFMGVCLLGARILEGIAGSELNVVKYSLEDANEHYLRFAESYDIPKEVADAARDGLALRAEYKRGSTNVGVRMAKLLESGKRLPFEKVKKISEYFPRHAKDNLTEKNPPSNGWISWQIWGGDAAKTWSKKIVESRDEKGGVVLNALGNKELEKRLWNALSQFVYSDGSFVGKRYYIEEVYANEHYMIVKDNQTDKYYKIPYSVEKDDKVKVDEDKRREVSYRFEERPAELKNTVTFAKEDWGKGEKLSVDKSAKAMSDSEWGKVDKTNLRKEILDASNYRTLVHDAYLVVESGWEDAPSEKLKYPVMEIKDGKLIYNRYGLSAALAYAKAEGEDAVVEKIDGLYKKLNIEGAEKVKNKLDKDNPELEKIRDDAEADEDDEKEEVDNAVDKPEQKKLKDDIDSDKDYWKKKYECDVPELRAKCADMEKEVGKYRKQCESYEKKELCAKYRKMFKDDAECDEMMKKCSKDELEDEIKNRALEFAVREKEDERVSPISKNSSDFPVRNFAFSADSVGTREDFIKKYSK